MRAVDIITKKRMGYAISDSELKYFLTEYLNNRLPDYQMSAFLMAVVFRGMEEQELLTYTTFMAKSGETITIPPSQRFIIDKHSTGGVGDKTSIALAPLLASLNMGVAKLSGRGLGHTGGTIDKFESIPHFKFMTDAQEMVDSLNKTGIGLLGYSDNIVPLDKRLYTLRDVTSTVQSIPLIASSIMSKKLAVHSDAIILDIKVGNGAFMHTLDEAKTLAHAMLNIGVGAGRSIICMLTNMNQPLGNAIGNALEFIEAVNTLKGNGPKDFTDLILSLAGTALLLRGDVKTIDEGKKIALDKIGSQAPLDYLSDFIAISGGDSRVIEDYSLLPQARHIRPISANSGGYIASFDTMAIGNAAMILGAGRAIKEDTIDPAAGIIIHKKQGDKIERGEKLATLYYNNETSVEISTSMILQSIKISNSRIEKPTLILDTIHRSENNHE